MSDSISGVIIPLIIPVDAPPSLASGVQALATSLEGTEFSNACLQLQQSFCYLTWHFADYCARHLQLLGRDHVACSAFGHARLQQHLEALQQNLDVLAQEADGHPEVGDVFRVFYVGGLRARQTSPRRHTRLLGLGGQSIRGYRGILEWCQLEVGEEEFSGELRCQRELRRYLPILREWLDSSSGHFRQIKTLEWYSNATVTESAEPEPAPAAPPASSSTQTAGEAPSDIAAEALTGLKTEQADPTATSIPLSNYHTPPLLWRHQCLFEEEAAAQRPSAYVTLGRLSGLAIQYLFAISASSLRSAGHLDAALEKRLDTGLTLRQKQTSLTFLFKALAQHQADSPLLEQVASAVHAPSGGKLSSWLTGTWGGGHSFAEFCLETAKSEPPSLWQERFLPGIRIWLQQSAAWFAQAEHYFQPPNDQGFISFTVQVGDDHLEADRKALQIDTAAVRIPIEEVAQLLSPVIEEASAKRPAPEPEVVAAEPPEPEPTAQLEAVAVEPPAPEPTAQPEAVAAEPPAPEPEPTPEPEVVAAEPPAPEPEPTPEPEVVAAESPAPEPEPTPEPEVVAAEPPAPEPEPTAEPEVVAAEPPAPEPEPEVVAAESPAPEPEPTPEPEVVAAEPPAPEPEPTPEPEVVAAESPAPEPEPTPEPEVVAAESPAPESTPEPEAAEVTLQSAEQEGWVGPDLALQLWDESIQTDQPTSLLRLISFLLQYSSGIAAEWQDIEAKVAPQSIAEAIQQIRQHLSQPGDTQVLLALGSGDDPASLSSWLHSQEFARWLQFDRNRRTDYHALARQWMTALQPFFQESEQLFEEPSAQGTLEGVVVHQDRYLEFVDRPIHVGDLSSPFWQAPTVQEEAPVPESEVAAPQACDPDFTCLPPCVTEYFGDLWPTEGVTCEGLAAGIEFFIQYFAGILTCAAIQEASLEASHLEAWRGDSNLLQRLDMLHQVLSETKDAEHATLRGIQKIFSDSVFSQNWRDEGHELANLAFALRSGHAEEHQRAAQILHNWFEASRELLGTLENLAEPVDQRGHLELVVQQDDLFLELVEPEFAIHLVQPGLQNWQDLAIYRNLSAKYGSQELLGSSEGSHELSGGAGSDHDVDDFFGAPAGDQEEMLTSLFKVPEVVVAEVPKPRPQLVYKPEEAAEPVTRTEHQLNAAMEKLLQNPEAAPEPAPPVVAEASGESAEKPEVKAPARLIATPAPVAEFIVVDPPILKHTIHYLAKEGQIHHGKIEILNTGGSLLKGTVKSNHPCLRVSPSVFRSNQTEIEFWIDDSDRPSNMQKIGLSFHFSGQKLEVPMEKLLPDKKFKQLASKVLGFVKNLRQKN